jgi:hypothetical protein
MVHYQITDTIAPTEEDFLLEDAEVLIKGDEVSIVYEKEPEKNRKFDFDRIKTFEFELRSVTGNNKVRAIIFRAYMDGTGMLHVEAEQALGQVNVYTTTGVLVASKKTGDNQAQINLSAVPRGVYVVQTGTNSLLIIK